MAGPVWAAEICAVTAALLGLQALRSRIAPALSAAVLPVVFGVTSWIYPATVLVTCLLIVATVSSSRPPADDRGGRGAIPAWQWAVVSGGWLVICAWILIAGPLLSLPAVTVAPPLLVSALDWLARDARRLTDGVRRWSLLVGAALLGSVAARLAPGLLLAGLGGVAATLLLVRLLATRHAPALAVSLIPLIGGPSDPWHFTRAIAIGAAALYIGATAVACVQRGLEPGFRRAFSHGFSGRHPQDRAP
jgi:hypothetical protein